MNDPLPPLPRPRYATIPAPPRPLYPATQDATKRETERKLTALRQKLKTSGTLVEDAPAPRWWYSLYTNQAEGCRVVCPACLGHCTSAYRAVVTACHECVTNLRPCPQHACRTCEGRGCVCPRCRGMRFCRVPLAAGADLESCAICAAGEPAILRAVMRYMQRNAER